MGLGGSDRAVGMLGTADAAISVTAKSTNCAHLGMRFINELYLLGEYRVVGI